jgi:ADP-ribosylglycohydrolase
MRIAPLGVAVGPTPLDNLVAAMSDAVRGTHFTGLAIAGASAVAAAVNLGLAGAAFAEQTRGAVLAAEVGQRLDHYAAARPWRGGSSGPWPR